MLIFNLSDQLLGDQTLHQDLAKVAAQRPHLHLNARLEDEVGQLPTGEQVAFLKAYGLAQSSLAAFSQQVLKQLQYQTFLTAGSQEVRAWLIPANCLAPQAAGVVHSDMERGFIAAEIININDLLKHQSWTRAKAAGVSRLEGRKYTMQPGDVVNFKFNV